MNPKEYQAAAQRTECDQLKSRVRMYGVRPYVPDDKDLLAPVRLNHAVIGMMGEVGEIAQLLEKWVYYGKPLDAAKIGEELGDVLWYAAELCNALGLDLGRIMEANIAKLKARYPEKYTDELADRANRNTEHERKAMEAASGPNPFKAKPFSSLYASDHVPNPPSLKEVNEALGRRFLAEGADPATIDGEEDIHQVKGPEPTWEQKLLAQPLKPDDCRPCHGSGYHRYPDFEDGTPNFSDLAPCGYCEGTGKAKS